VVIEVSPSCVGGPTLEGAMHNERDESKALMTPRHVVWMKFLLWMLLFDHAATGLPKSRSQVRGLLLIVMGRTIYRLRSKALIDAVLQQRNVGRDDFPTRFGANPSLALATGAFCPFAKEFDVGDCEVSPKRGDFRP
jgi:hypothetical protein